MEWHSLTIQEVLQKCNTDEQNGLSVEQAKQKLEQTGPNKLAEKKKKSLLVRF